VSLAAPLVDDNDEEDEQSLDEFVDETNALSSAFWAARFRELGKPYRAPQVVKARPNQRIRSLCGNSRGADHSYCGWDETVFFDSNSDSETSFETLWDDDRSLVIVTTVAHEWGHHVQQLLGLFDIDDRSVEVENQADCLMGILVASYNASSGWVTRADMRDATEDTRDAGDDPATSFIERTHGTPEERMEAFMRGYQGRALASCGI
jgi:predicted metalloprotease